MIKNMKEKNNISQQPLVGMNLWSTNNSTIIYSSGVSQLIHNSQKKILRIINHKWMNMN